MHTSRPPKLLTACVALLAAAMLAAPSYAQPKAPPPGSGGAESAEGGVKKGPPTLGQRQQEFQEVDRDLIRDFQDFYEDDDEPTMLVLIGMDNRVSSGGEDQSIAPSRKDGWKGTAVDKPGVGQNLSLYDPTGLTEQIESELSGWLLKNRALDLIDVESLSDLDRREVDVLLQNNEDGAVELMATRLNADIVYYIKLQPVPAHLQTGETIPYKMIAQIKDVQRGRRVDSYSLNYRGSTDIHRTRAYAAELARWFMTSYNDYVENRPRGRRYTIHIIGLQGDDDVYNIRQAIDKTLDHKVQGKIKASYVENAADSYTEIGIKYDGDSLDLSHDVRKAVEKEMGLELYGFDTQGGILRMRVGAAKEAPPKTLESKLLDQDPDLLADLKERYNKKGQPKVGVVINWLVRPDQMSAQVQGTLPMVVMQGDARIGRNIQGPNTIGIDEMEGAIAKTFRNYGMTVVDPDQVRTVLNKQADKVETLGQGDDVASLLRAQDGFDILIYGLANITKGNITDAEEIQYSLKIKDLNTGEFLGSQSWHDRDVEEKLERMGRDPEDFDIRNAEEVGDYIGYQLLYMIYRNYLAADGTLEVTIKGARSFKQVNDVAKTIEEGDPNTRTALNSTFENGVGKFTLRYAGEYEDLVRTIGDEMAADFYEIEEANRGRMVLSPKKLPEGEG